MTDKHAGDHAFLREHGCEAQRIDAGARHTVDMRAGDDAGVRPGVGTTTAAGNTASGEFDAGDRTAVARGSVQGNRRRDALAEPDIPAAPPGAAGGAAF